MLLRHLAFPSRALATLAALVLTSVVASAQTPPTVSLSTDTADVAERGGSATITATLSAPADGPVALTLGDARDVFGTGAELGVDYAVSDGDARAPGLQIVIRDGETTGFATITAVDDDAFEGAETAAVYVASTSGRVLDPACLRGVGRADKAFRRAALADAARGAGCVGAVRLLDDDLNPVVGDDGTEEDAGNIVDAAALALAGDAASFFGQIGNGPEQQTVNDVDCFAFNVADAAAFGAELFEGATVPILFDSQFHLFGDANQLVLFDDDDGSDPNGTYSRFAPGELSAAGGGPGLYTLCVTSPDNVAVLDDETLVGWNGDGSAAGSYRVELTGVGPGGGAVVQFATAQRTVSEGAGAVAIEIVASGLTGPVAATVTLASGDPADLGGFTSATTTLGQAGTSPPYTVTVPITDDDATEDDRSFVLTLSVDAPNQVGNGTLTLVVTDDDGASGEPVVTTVPSDGGLQLFSLPVDGVTVGAVADAAGADEVFVYDAATAALVPATPGTTLRAGQPVLVDVDPDATLTVTGVAPTSPAVFDRTTVEALGGSRVLVAVGNPAEGPISLSALTVEGGTLADVALVFDPMAGAFVPISLAGIGCCDGPTVDLLRNEALILQVIPFGDPADVRVGVDGAAGGTGDSVTEAAFEPTDDEAAVVLALQPAGADGASRLAADAPGDVFALRFAVGGGGLDVFDGLDVASPLGATLASPGLAGAGPLFAALSLDAPTPAAPVAVPLTVRVPTAGAYEIALAETPRDVDGRPVVVEVFDGATPIRVEVGTPFQFAVAEGDSVLAGRFSVQVSLQGGVSTEASPERLALAVYPNPSSGRATVSLSGAAGVVRVVVVDALGREVAVLHDGPAPGALALPLDVRRLVPGPYLVRVVGPGVAETRSLTVIR